MKIPASETEECEKTVCLRLQPEHSVSCTRDALDAASAADHADAEIVST